MLCNFIILHLHECWLSTCVLHHTQECWYYTITHILLTNYIIISVFNIQRCTHIGDARFYVTANWTQNITNIRTMLFIQLTEHGLTFQQTAQSTSYILHTFGRASLPHCYSEFHLLYKAVQVILHSSQNFYSLPTSELWLLIMTRVNFWLKKHCDVPEEGRLLFTMAILEGIWNMQFKVSNYLKK